MKPLPLLVLWDIDGTLLVAGDNGRNAYHEAGLKIFGASFTVDGVDKLGRMDSAIWQDVVQLNGHIDVTEPEDQFRKHYLQCLKDQIDQKSEIQLLPGVRELVHRLDRTEYVTQGILSGNYPEIGRLKIQSAGIDCSRFKVWTGGTDSRTRAGLVPVALSRYTDLTGNKMDMERTIIIGDTPRDIVCAKENNCRCISVTTGKAARSSLVAAGAEIIFDDLSETEKVMGYILGW